MKRTRSASTPAKRQRVTGPKSYKQKLRKALQATETGHIDTPLQTYEFDTTGTVVHINAIPQGTSPTMRVGKKVMLKSIQCRGLFEQSTSIVTKNAFLIVYDKRPISTVPAITEILETSSSYALNNDDNSSRFVILKREDFVSVGDLGGEVTDSSARVMDFFLDLKGLRTEFGNSSTGGMGNMEYGALYAVTIGHVASGQGSADMTFRLRYNDV